MGNERADARLAERRAAAMAHATPEQYRAALVPIYAEARAIRDRLSQLREALAPWDAWIRSLGWEVAREWAVAGGYPAQDMAALLQSVWNLQGMALPGELDAEEPGWMDPGP